MSRPNKDEYFVRMAALVATRSTCVRRSVGCVLVNARGHVLATGYNGVAAGRPHCNEPKHYSSGPGVISTTYPNMCEGGQASSGEALDECEAVHAEQNALLQCRDVWSIATCYVTVFPCVHCAKLLLNTSCERIVYVSDYSDAGVELWARAGKTAKKLSNLSLLKETPHIPRESAGKLFIYF